MKEIRRLHYVTSGLLILMFLEGMTTLGSAYNFEDYSTFGWIAQFIIVSFTVLSALRIANEVED